MKHRKKKYQPYSYLEQVLHLRALNKKGRLALFLGAGISAGCGLPAWKDLLLCLRKKIGQVTAGEEQNIADKAREIFGNRFNYEVADCLYRNGVEISDSLKAVANCGVSKMVCFNFDDLLEEALTMESVPHRVVLNGENFNANYPRLLVFHPHGYLGRFDTASESADSNIVLSRSDYESLYGNHYCLTNLIQLSMLINHSVLFVGMSLTDQNTVRLLKASREVGVRHWHYALFKDCERNIRKERTLALRALGVDPVWIRDYTKVPEIFTKIRVHREEALHNAAD